jgi:membrane protease YdiL (CAAX protease family)
MNDKNRIPGILSSVLIILASYIFVFFLNSLIIQMMVGKETSQIPPSTLKWFIGLMEFLLLVLPTWYLIRMKYDVKQIYFLKKTNWNYLFWVLVFSVGIFPLTDELDRIVQQIFHFEPIGEEFFEMMKYNSLGEFIFLLFSIAGVASFSEELLFRGLIFKSVSNKLGPIQGILFSALIWAILHGIINWTLQIFIIGLILGLLVYISKSIWPPVLFHAVNNGLTLLFVNTNEHVIQAYYEAHGHVKPLILVIAIIIVFFSAKKCLFRGTKSVKL